MLARDVRSHQLDQTSNHSVQPPAHRGRRELADPASSRGDCTSDSSTQPRKDPGALLQEVQAVVKR
jgi:hypothetical protein